jgi:plastocyanin
VRKLSIPALLLLSLPLAASGRPAGPAVIEMTEHLMFLPRELTVTVGEVVTWKNASTMSHSVNFLPENCRTEDGKKWIKMPTGATAFTSGEIKAGDQYYTRFEIPGTYQYLCTFHEDQMRGTVIVQGSK